MGGEENQEAVDGTITAVQNNSVVKTTGRWLADRVWNFSALLIVLLAVGAGISLFARSHWLCDLAANLRVQQVIAIAVAAAMALLYRRWRWLGFVCLMLAFHMLWFTSAWTGKPDAGASSDLTIMVTNVLTSNGRHDLVLNQIRAADPDVFAVVELGTPLSVRLDQEISDTYPYRISDSQDTGNFGIGLYSKYPIKDSATFALNVESIWSIEATVSKNDQEYRIVATHPLPPMGRRMFNLRNQHLRQLTARINEFQRQGHATPVILVGDFNLTPWSPLFTDLLAQSGLSRAGEGTGLTPTWYAKQAFPFGLKLDHVLISDHLQCTHHEVGGDIGSDHRAVIVGLKNR